MMQPRVILDTYTLPITLSWGFEVLNSCSSPLMNCYSLRSQRRRCNCGSHTTLALSQQYSASRSKYLNLHTPDRGLSVRDSHRGPPWLFLHWWVHYQTPSVWYCSSSALRSRSSDFMNPSHTGLFRLQRCIPL